MTLQFGTCCPSRSAQPHQLLPEPVAGVLSVELPQQMPVRAHESADSAVLHGEGGQERRALSRLTGGEIPQSLQSGRPSVPGCKSMQPSGPKPSAKNSASGFEVRNSAEERQRAPLQVHLEDPQRGHPPPRALSRVSIGRVIILKQTDIDYAGSRGHRRLRQPQPEGLRWVGWLRNAKPTPAASG